MSFNFLNLTRLPALTLSVSALSLSLLSGCSGLEGYKGASQSTPVETSSSRDQYDSYYGMPKSASKDHRYSPKIARVITKAKFKHNAPQRYVVKKGDTLWGISNKFLKNPAYWPEVWDKNQKVKNPHLIYPGDVLFIYQGHRNVKLSDGSIVEKLIPQMRIERNGGGEPISTLSPFLVWPKVLDQDTINNAPYIVDARDANLLIERGQTVYVKNLKDRKAGGEYAIFNVGDVISDPETRQEFGREVTYSGFLNVEQPALHADVATAEVVESKREIRRGDRLLYIEDHTHALNTPITIPTHQVRGTIISLFDAEMITGQTQVITINKGARSGIKTGYTLGVYSPGKMVDDPIAKQTGKKFYEPTKAVKVGIPPSRAATAIVYKVLNDISYAVITGSTHEVKNGFKIGNP